jgi:hypothetical protein
VGAFGAGVRGGIPAGDFVVVRVAPAMQNERREDLMLGVIIGVAGTLLLITAGTRRRPAVQPVRVNGRKR